MSVPFSHNNLDLFIWQGFFLFYGKNLLIEIENMVSVDEGLKWRMVGVLGSDFTYLKGAHHLKPAPTITAVSSFDLRNRKRTWPSP